MAFATIYVRFPRRIAPDRKAARKALASGIAEAAFVALRVAKRLAPVDEGALRRQIVATRTGEFSWIVSPGVSYAPHVELGREPGAKMPPWRELLGWVGRHYSIVQAIKAAYFERVMNPGARGGATEESFRRSAAFVVARSIGERGIAPRPFMGPAAVAALRHLEREFPGDVRAAVAS